MPVSDQNRVPRQLRFPAPVNKRPNISRINIVCIRGMQSIYFAIITPKRDNSPVSYVAGGSRSIVKLAPAAGDTYKLANQVLIPLRFTPISPHPAANTLIRPLILQDKSFRSSYGPFVDATVSRIGSRESDRTANDNDSPRSLLLAK